MTKRKTYIIIIGIALILASLLTLYNLHIYNNGTCPNCGTTYQTLEAFYQFTKMQYFKCPNCGTHGEYIIWLGNIINYFFLLKH